MRGRAFINALAELPDPSHPAYRSAADEKFWLLNLFEHLATTAGCIRPDELAAQLLVLHEGALATHPLGHDTIHVSAKLARQLTLASSPDNR